MAYNTLIFEKAMHAYGYVIERIAKDSQSTVKSVFGAVIEGTLVKRVRWNTEGKCFSPKGKALSKYDLPLEAVYSILLNKSISSEEFKQLKSITYDTIRDSD